MRILPIRLGRVDAQSKLSMGIGHRAKTGLIALLVFGNLVSCTQERTSSERAVPHVVVSLGVFETLVVAIGGDRVSTMNVARGATEAHDLELTPDQATSLHSADLVIAGPKGFQALVDDAVAARSKQTLRLDPHQASGNGVHFWIDPHQLTKASALIGASLRAVMSTDADRAYVQKRLRVVTEQLEGLATTYDARLQTHRLDALAAEHASMTPLAARYRFEVLALSGTAHDSEPTPEQIDAVAAALRAGTVQSILIEPASTRSLALAALRAAQLSGRAATERTQVFNSLELTAAPSKDVRSPQQALAPLTAALDRNLASLCRALSCETR